MDETEVKEILDHKALRDRFAIAALPVVIQDMPIPLNASDKEADEMVSAKAYAIADAMLKERDR